ncbi:MAG: hypothetical protein AAGB14_09570 [Verrucomicrobiota bacterium]
MDGIRELAKTIDREKVERARLEPIEAKLLDGPRLFRQSCEFMRAGIRITDPKAEEEKVEQLLWERNYGSLSRLP